MDARADADYMAWWSKNGSMNNPDMEYDAWCAGKNLVKKHDELVVGIWAGFPESFRPEDRVLLMLALKDC